MADTTATSAADPAPAAVSQPANDAVPGKTEVANKGDSSPSTGLLETVKRYIPGLANSGDGGASAASKAKRNRNRGAKKASAATTTTTAGGNGNAEIASAQDPALASALTDHAPSKSELPDNLVSSGGAATTGEKKRPAALNGSALVPGSTVGGSDLSQEEIAALDKRQLNPTASIQKRLRATGKKLQRIQAYESQSEALNADQKKALASKPVLEAVQKELQELLKIFEEEEKDEDRRLEKKKSHDERLVQQKVSNALNNANVNTQNDLTLLLQFLHLYSLFNPSNSGIMPPTLPPVVSNATGQQHAAVHTLFHNLANGPLFGGQGDATEQIKALQSGSEQAVIEGVSFADVKQMILDLTAPPAEVGGHEISSDAGEQSAEPANLESSEEAQLVGGEGHGANEPSLNFIQASEIGNGASSQTALAPETSENHLQPSAPVTSADETNARALEAVSNATTPGAGAPVTGLGWGQQGGLTQGSIPTGDDWSQPSVPIKSWADEVDDTHPSDPFTARPDVPSELAVTEQSSVLPSTEQSPILPSTEQSPIAAVTENGAGAAEPARGGRGRGGRGGRGGGRGRGEYRGENRGEHRGGYRGSYQRDGRSAGEWTSSQPRQIRDPSDAAQAAIRAAESSGQPDADGFVTAAPRRPNNVSNNSGGFGSGRGGPGRGRGDGSFRGRRPEGARGRGGEGYRGRGGAPRGGDRGAEGVPSAAAAAAPVAAAGNGASA